MEPAKLSEAEIFRKISDLLESGKRVALCTITSKRGSAPREVGATVAIDERGNIYGTIGGGEFERSLIDAALRALKEGKSTSLKFGFYAKTTERNVIETGLICGGEVTVFINVLKPKPELIIVGAGHVSWYLARIADLCGFNVIIVDDNEALANKERYPMAKEIIVGAFDKVLKKLRITPLTSVAILHGDPMHDYEALRFFTGKPLAYIGLLGSKTKVAKLFNMLKKSGISSEKLAMVKAPIGLDIGAKTPPEISVSIMAEIIKEIKAS